MPDRFTVSEVQQIGIESAPGTAAVPTIQFQALSMALDTNLEYDEFAPAGQLVNSIVAPRREWSTGSLSGFPTYTEMAYVFSNLFGAAVVTTPTGATLERQWVWTPDKALPWTPKTWTVRRGDNSTAEEVNYALLSGLNLGFSRTAAPTLGGDLFAQRMNYAAALATTGVTTKTNVPILPSEIDTYLDATGAGIGTTKLLRDFDYTLTFSGFFGNIWPLNTSNTSYAAHSIQKPDLGTTIQLGNDAAGRALVTNMRAGSSVFVRLKATSSTMIELSAPYSLTIDAALKCVDAPSRQDVDGLSVLQWSFRNVYDATWAKWLQITMRTDFATL